MKRTALCAERIQGSSFKLIMSNMVYFFLFQTETAALGYGLVPGDTLGIRSVCVCTPILFFLFSEKEKNRRAR